MFGFPVHPGGDIRARIRPLPAQSRAGYDDKRHFTPHTEKKHGEKGEKFRPRRHATKKAPLPPNGFAPHGAPINRPGDIKSYRMERYHVIHSTDSLSVRLPVAGVGSRSYAFIIDWHIRFLLALAWILAAALAFQFIAWLGQNPESWLFGGWFMYIGLYPALFIYVFYHPVLEMGAKQTPGKRYAGVKLVALDGGTPTVAAMLTRNIFRVLDSLPVFYIVGFVVAMFTRNHTRIGDLAAGTVLIHDEALRDDVLEHLAADEDGGLSLQERELLLDILNRWGGMDIHVRVDLAKRFLARVGAQISRPPPPGRLVETDRALRRALTAIKEKGARNGE